MKLLKEMNQAEKEAWNADIKSQAEALKAKILTALTPHENERSFFEATLPNKAAEFHLQFRELCRPIGEAIGWPDSTLESSHFTGNLCAKSAQGLHAKFAEQNIPETTRNLLVSIYGVTKDDSGARGKHGPNFTLEELRANWCDLKFGIDLNNRSLAYAKEISQSFTEGIFNKDLGELDGLQHRFQKLNSDICSFLGKDAEHPSMVAEILYPENAREMQRGIFSLEAKNCIPAEILITMHQSLQVDSAALEAQERLKNLFQKGKDAGEIELSTEREAEARYREEQEIQTTSERRLSGTAEHGRRIS